MAKFGESKEIYVKASNQNDYDKAKEVLKKFGISTATKEKFIFNDVYVNLSETEFASAREKLYEEVPACLVLASEITVYTMTGGKNCNYYLKVPNDEEEYYKGYDSEECEYESEYEDEEYYEEEYDDEEYDDEEYDDEEYDDEEYDDEEYDDEEYDDKKYGIPQLYTSSVNNLDGCLTWISEAGFDIDESALESVYAIFGKQRTKRTVSRNDVEDVLKYFIVENPKSCGPISKDVENIYRFCAIGKTSATLERLKNVIASYAEEGTIEKAIIIPNKNMLYFTSFNYYYIDWDEMLYDEDEDEDAEKNDFIIVADYFDIYCHDNSIDIEGMAQCVIGNGKEKRKSYDFTSKLYKRLCEDVTNNSLVNITDIWCFLQKYGFKLTSEEKLFISDFN